ncbi:CsbD family protein [Limosilactobacillus sp. WF-MT5-A]|uniref:CsbD family protein n=1 Tax=Limosilactobacillus agrestis TaxID=2759748 RepID=UPI0015FB3602|nr:CsbD family protein [Limosilactobacillus agrestis]MBB1098555.1 CsbD family protein [Limosilactobacillus agrestis]MCD7125951.1 CsbD family protein [Limosilactobacillus agrestis]
MKGLMILASDKHGIKDKLVGKLKEVEGKITNDKARETEGKLQKAKDKATDLKETLKDNKEG